MKKETKNEVKSASKQGLVGDSGSVGQEGASGDVTSPGLSPGQVAPEDIDPVGDPEDDKTTSTYPQERQSSDVNTPDTNLVSGFSGVPPKDLAELADAQNDAIIQDKIDEVQSSDPKDQPTVLSYSQDPAPVDPAPSNDVSERKTAKGIILEAERLFADKFVNKEKQRDFKASEYKSPVELWEAAFPNTHIPVVVALVESEGKYKDYRKDDLEFFKEGLSHYRPHSDLQRLFYRKNHEEQDLELLNKILTIGGKQF